MLLHTLCTVLIKLYIYFQCMLWEMCHEHIMCSVLVTHQYVSSVHQCCTILVMQLTLPSFVSLTYEILCV